MSDKTQRTYTQYNVPYIYIDVLALFTISRGLLTLAQLARGQDQGQGYVMSRNIWSPQIFVSPEQIFQTWPEILGPPLKYSFPPRFNGLASTFLCRIEPFLELFELFLVHLRRYPRP